MIANYEDREGLPLGVLQDCREIMYAQALMARGAGPSQPTQDLLAQEMAHTDG